MFGIRCRQVFEQVYSNSDVLAVYGGRTHTFGGIPARNLRPLYEILTGFSAFIQISYSKKPFSVPLFTFLDKLDDALSKRKSTVRHSHVNIHSILEQV